MKLQQPTFAGWRAKVEQATKARTVESKGDDYDPKSRDKAFGPFC